MIAAKIKNIKQFMNLFFNTGSFDGFTVEEATIKTFATYNIDGLYEKDFFDPDEEAETSAFPDLYTPWKLLKNSCRDIIKGKHTPVFMKFVLHGDITRFSDSPGFSGVKALILIIRFENTGLSLTTGTSMKEFIMDSDVDRLWDNEVKRLLTSLNVEYEEL